MSLAAAAAVPEPIRLAVQVAELEVRAMEDLALPQVKETTTVVVVVVQLPMELLAK
jgi:hypothetical protein